MLTFRVRARLRLTVLVSVRRRTLSRHEDPFSAGAAHLGSPHRPDSAQSDQPLTEEVGGNLHIEIMMSGTFDIDISIYII